MFPYIERETKTIENTIQACLSPLIIQNRGQNVDGMLFDAFTFQLKQFKAIIFLFAKLLFFVTLV